MDKKYAMMMNDTIKVVINHGPAEKEEVHLLYRIRALESFADIKKGELGGYIEFDYNLSQNGYCWVYEDSMVFGDAIVSDDAKIRDHSMVFGNARVCDTAVIAYNSRVFDNARIYGTAHVLQNAMVFGNTYVSDEAAIFDNAMVFGDALVHDNAIIQDGAAVFGRSDIHDYAVISGNSKVVDKFIGGNTRITTTPEMYVKIKIS